jgi:transcriptional regulator with XRE-family HTH domain
MARPRATDWPAGDRERFWQRVRELAARLKVDQASLARALNVHPSVVSRRLGGQNRERPMRPQVQSLALLLGANADPSVEPELLALAGYAAPETAEESRAAPPGAFRRLGPWAVIGGVGLGLALFALAVGVAVWRGRASAGPGGLWVAPDAADAVSGPARFAARAYPSSDAGSEVTRVIFTVSWPGRAGPWHVACEVFTPVRQNRYECEWDPAAETEVVPAGVLNISFDVYDRAGRAARAGKARAGAGHRQPGQRAAAFAPRAGQAGTGDGGVALALS